MATTSPLTDTPIPEPSDNIIDLLEVTDAVLNLEKYSVPRYANAGARDADIPAPVAGQAAAVGTGASTIVTVYNGSAWTTINWSIEPTTPLQGTYNAAQRPRLYSRTYAATTDANGDTIVLTSAQIAGGAVLAPHLSGSSTFQITAAFRMVSGNLVARIWSGTTLAASTSISLTFDCFLTS